MTPELVLSELTPASCGLLIGAFGFAVFLPMHLIIVFLQRGEAPAQAMSRTFAVCLLAAAAACAVLWGPHLEGLFLAEVYAVLTMMCLFVVYAPFLFTVYTSLSIETLLIVQRSDAPVAITDLQRRFCSLAFLQRRVDNMVEGGFLSLSGDRYSATPKGRLVTRSFLIIKQLLRLGAGG